MTKAAGGSRPSAKDNALVKRGDTALGKLTSALEIVDKLAASIVEGKGKKAQVLHLPPVWPENMSISPNTFIRSALFGVSNTHERVDDKLIAVLGKSVKMRYSGELLSQYDAGTLEILFHLANSPEMRDIRALTEEDGSPIMFSAYSFLKACGLDYGKAQRMMLEASLNRFAKGTLTLNFQDRNGSPVQFVGSLLDYARFGTPEHWKYKVWLNPRLEQLLSPGQYSLVNLEHRFALRRHPLALWLLRFYASHADPIPLPVATLHELTNSQSEMAHFKRLLNNALLKMLKVGALKSAEIDSENRVHVTPVTSFVQRKFNAAKEQKVVAAAAQKKKSQGELDLKGKAPD